MIGKINTETYHSLYHKLNDLVLITPIFDSWDFFLHCDGIKKFWLIYIFVGCLCVSHLSLVLHKFRQGKIWHDKDWEKSTNYFQFHEALCICDFIFINIILKHIFTEYYTINWGTHSWIYYILKTITKWLIQEANK